VTARRILRWVLVVVAALPLVAIGRPALHLWRVARGDHVAPAAPAPGTADDVSRMSTAAVAEVVPVPAESAAAERVLAELLARARRERLGVAIAGARHSMGGHTIAPRGIVLDMRPYAGMALNADGTVLTVGAGARWTAILPFLDARGRSVAVMQSFSSFTVGGTLSVNAHGQQFGRPPVASTVRAIRLLRADGSIIRCSPTENAELFRLVLGGYGLFGVILDAELETVPNELYRREERRVRADAFAAAFDSLTRDSPDVALAYGRVRVTRRRFLQDAIITVMRRVAAPPPPAGLPALEPLPSPRLRRLVFRGSAGNDYGKRLRWNAERWLTRFGGSTFSRNRLLHIGVEDYESHAPDSTDVLQEYFVPPDSLARFLARVRDIVPRHGADLINLTIRDVRRDTITFLAFARGDVFALVLDFVHARTAAADSAIAAMTRELIDAALAAGGTYYLPYRLQATDEQLRRAYPMADEFFRLKRRYDPEERFTNMFYVRYGGGRARR